nr:CPBP family intramembrane glutamic endopeptidase [Ruegeria arenilitoris]
MLLPTLFLLGLTTGAVRPEIGLPSWWLIFALSNLFLTCLTEEAFFRGYLQSVFISKTGTTIGIVAASLLFGLAHAGGGPALVVFASILGAACGLGYFATGRLWVPVLMHFGFNALHLALFTYPGPV